MERTEPQGGQAGPVKRSRDLMRRKLEEDEIDARLKNWGRWLRYDDTLARLGLPTQSPWVFSPRKGGMIADLDAEHMEWVITCMYCSGLDYPHLHAFILRVEYAEHPEGQVPPVSQRAADVRRRFKRPCAERTYYHHLANARRAAFVLAGPMVRG